MADLGKYVSEIGDFVRPGQPLTSAVTAARLNGMIGAIRALARGENIRAGIGLLKSEAGNGVILSSLPTTSSSTASAPFDISFVTLGPTTYAVFRAGTINGLLPSNYATGVVVPASGTKYLVLNCTASNGQITAASFSADAAAPAAITPYAGQPPVSLKILSGLSINAVATKIWTGNNIQAMGKEMFRLSAASPVAGQLPYTIYYTWELSSL